jgi:hypothetical protein
MPTTIPRSDEAFRLWLVNFFNQCDAYQVLLKITPEQAAAIGAAQSAFNGTLEGVDSAKASLAAAVQDKDIHRRDAVDIVAPLIKKFQADKTIPANVLALLQVAQTGGGGGKAPLYAPTDLVAYANATESSVSLAFNRNGNPGRTTFVVEALAPGDEGWRSVLVTTRTKVKLEGFTPGVQTQFRVYAHRAGNSSGVSNVATIYGEGTQAAA